MREARPGRNGAGFLTLYVPYEPRGGAGGRGAGYSGYWPPFAAFFSAASSMTASATCCIDIRRSIDVF